MITSSGSSHGICHVLPEGGTNNWILMKTSRRDVVVDTIVYNFTLNFILTCVSLC